jgi:hypothetical protein
MSSGTAEAGANGGYSNHRQFLRSSKIDLIFGGGARQSVRYASNKGSQNFSDLTNLAPDQKPAGDLPGNVGSNTL